MNQDQQDINTFTKEEKDRFQNRYTYLDGGMYDMTQDMDIYSQIMTDTKGMEAERSRICARDKNTAGIWPFADIMKMCLLDRSTPRGMNPVRNVNADEISPFPIVFSMVVACGINFGLISDSRSMHGHLMYEIKKDIQLQML